MTDTANGLIGVSSRETAWKALHYFNLYRITLAGLFVTLTATGRLLPPLGVDDLPMFFFTSVIYLVFALISATLIVQRRPRYQWQVMGQGLFDIVAITVLMYASGGVVSGVGMLMVASIVGTSVLTAGRTGILFAALATIAVLIEEAWAWAYAVFPVANYTHAGLLGATFFATAWLGHVLARQVRESEALAAQRGIHLQNLARLNEHIVERMQSGIMVLDGDDTVRLVNIAARNLMGLGESAQGAKLRDRAPELAETLRLWRISPDHTPALVQPASSNAEALVSMTALDEGGSVLVFIEDASVMRQRAQQLKLASLGRLAASIAHEVRNPLGAISHAGQLLSEVSSLDADSRRLTEIIGAQSKRVNAIIENVLLISRREQSTPEEIDLRDWLERFVAQYIAENKIDASDILVNTGDSKIIIRMDSEQMRQVLANLCDNGMRYGEGSPVIELQAGYSDESQRSYLDVINRGAPIPKRITEQLFEPFFTTEAAGSGLGLYIARELCESNRATLQLLESSESLTRFRIGFTHPDRHQLNIA